MKERKLVYTVMSKHSSFAKEIVCAHAFCEGVVPLNPFSMFGYFLYDMVDRDVVRSANAHVISVVDEVWSYGPIADGCMAELTQALEEGKKLRFYSVARVKEDIRRLNFDDLEFEEELLKNEFRKIRRDISSFSGS